MYPYIELSLKQHLKTGLFKFHYCHFGTCSFKLEISDDFVTLKTFFEGILFCTFSWMAQLLQGGKGSVVMAQKCEVWINVMLFAF